MPSVFVYSAGQTASEHFARTIERGLPLDTLRPFLAAELLSKLTAAYPQGDCYVWGDRGGEHGRQYWERMQPGDLALCYREKKIVGTSHVVATAENESAGRAAWPDATSEPYRLLFFLTKPVWTDVPVANLPQYFGKVYQGLRRLPSSEQIMHDFGSLDRFVAEALLGSAGAGARGRTSRTLPDTLPSEVVREAIGQYDAGTAHGFADSTGYDLVYDGRRYPPKAIVGLAARLATGTEFGPEDFSGGVGSKCFRLLQQAGFEIVDKSTNGVWLFQGNPARYDINDYLSRYAKIYWSTPRYQQRIAVGDRCVLWRAGPDAGAVAVGRVVEQPTPRSEVKEPECLGDDLWVEEPDAPTVMKVGIEIDEVRLDAQADYVPRQAFLDNPALKSSTIIRAPNGTVFHLTDVEAREFFGLWRSSLDLTSDGGFETVEGGRRLRKHYARERCRQLVIRKKQDFASRNAGRVFCEVCGFDFVQHYPPALAEGFIEAHHLSPLFTREEPRRTTLDDLLLVCSNCHRMIHSSSDTDGNLATLRQHFSERRE